MQTADEFAAYMQEVLQLFQRLHPDQKEVCLQLLRQLAISNALSEPPEDREALFESYKERLDRLAG